MAYNRDPRVFTAEAWGLGAWGLYTVVLTGGGTTTMTMMVKVTSSSQRSANGNKSKKMTKASSLTAITAPSFFQTVCY